MKKLFFMAASVLLFSYTTKVVATTQPTPFVKNSSTPIASNPFLTQLNLEMKRQLKQISTDKKNGKLTADQYNTLSRKIVDINMKILSYCGSNADHKMTIDQTTEIYKQLKNNAPSIP